MKYFYTFLVSIFTIGIVAQDFSMEAVKGMKPRNIGPGGMSGRVTAIDVVTSNPDVMYVGTASGGLWKSESGGITWKPVFDKENTASIGAVAIQQSNPSVIWVGTGEGNPRNSLNGGYGVYRSLDGGKNWELMGLEKTRHIHRVIIDPTDPNTVYVGAIGSPWGEHPERGVFKTTDGGITWRKVLFANNRTGVADLVIDPQNPNKLIAALWEHKRDPWFFKSGGEGSGLYVSHDKGETWVKRTDEDGLPKGELGRIGIAIAANKPNIVYALIEAKKNALYKSTDGGFKWKKINDKNDIGNRPFYYSDIFVDPQNENRVYSVFTYVNVSEDGGKNFKQLMPAYGVDNGVHPDHHAWWIHPNDGSFMIDGNDGGMNITYDGGESWRFIGNLPVAQFYHISTDNEFPYNVYGGMQDNGSWRGPAYVWRAQGIRNDYWQEIAFGDGFDVVPDLDDSRYGYAMSQQGFVSRYDWKTGNNYIVRPTHPDADVKLRFNWNSGIGQDPFDNSTVYFGSQFVHKSTNKGLTWEVISPDLTTNDPEKQKQSESGGLTMDATGAENHCTILVIEPSVLEKDVLWIGTDDGNIQITKDGGKSWTNVVSKIKGFPKGSWIAQIKASNKNKGEALVVVNDYRRFNYTPYVYRTTDYGNRWERIVDENDVKSYALSIVEDPENKNLLFLGTDDGLYISLDAGNQWTKWTEGFPTVSTKDLVIHPREHDLVIGTFGRAAWVLDDIRPLRAIAENRSVLNKEIALFETPTAYQAAYQQPTGSRFGADAIFNGENRKEGAKITYYLNKKEAPEKASKSKEDEEEDENDEKEVKKDSISLMIYDGDRLIRTLKIKTPKKNGMHHMYWGMDEKGADRPSRKLSKNKNPKETGGVLVKPGTYKVKIEYGENTDETTVTVKSDPRLDSSPEAIAAVYEKGKHLQKLQQTTADVVKQLAQSKETATTFQKRLKEEDKEKYKDAIKASKDITKKIDSLMAIYIGKEDKRQGITRNPEPNVNQRIQTANFYVGSRKTGITSTEEQLIKHAENSLKEAIEQTNAFFATDWKAYRESMEKIALSPFKETKSFQM
ncbi:WD40/YVTN/BNR-like repeat-containing protein [Flavobacteriaceae bacterium M23B6Z8]